MAKAYDLVQDPKPVNFNHLEDFKESVNFYKLINFIKVIKFTKTLKEYYG